MPFQPLASTRSVRWRAAEGEGLEHLTIVPMETGLRVRSVVCGTFGGHAYGASYAIDLDAHWGVRSFQVETTEGRRLALSSRAPGRWLGEDGTARDDLDGCVDIDLSATPFTNTLPIRRLGLRPDDGEVALKMLYVPFDSFEPFPDVQFYRALDEGHLYRFVNDDRSFEADLALDGDGLVLDYPSLFKRL